MMANEVFDYPYLLGDDGDVANDDKLCIDLDTVMSVLDEDTNPSEVWFCAFNECADEFSQFFNAVSGGHCEF